MDKFDLERAEQGYEDMLEELDRFRAALKKIAGPDPESTLDEPDLDYEVVVKLRAIASAALSNEDQWSVM